MKIGNKWYAVPPCPDFDVAGMEQWLSEMAVKGWQLTEEGIFCGVACFQAASPARLRFRLDGAAQDTGILGPTGGLPEDEVQGLYGEMGWRYVATRGQFHIYCTGDSEAPELHTDPAVEALALDRVRSRRRGALITMMMWLVVYPLIFWHSPPLLTLVETGTWFLLMGMALVLWLLMDGLRELRYYRQFQKALRSGGETLPVRSHPGLYLARRLIRTGLLVLWVVLLLMQWSRTTLDEDKQALTEYQGTPPFATLTELAGEGAEDYHQTMQGMDFNAVREWSDVLAPRCMSWAEHAAVTRGDGTVLDGGLYLSYYEMKTEWLAHQLLGDLHRRDRREKNWEPMELVPVDADEALAYRDRAHMPTLLFRKGRVVVSAALYTVSPEGYSMEDWAPVLIGSVAEK